MTGSLMSIVSGILVLQVILKKQQKYFQGFLSFLATFLHLFKILTTNLHLQLFNEDQIIKITVIQNH